MEAKGVPLQVTVNGERQEFSEPLTVSDLIDKLQIRRRGIAVELNGTILNLAQHSETVLSDGDQLEVVSLAGGG